MFWPACKLEKTSGSEESGGGGAVGVHWSGAPMRGWGCHRLSQWTAVSH